MDIKNSSIKILPSTQALAENYDAWFVDIWGVVHNGVEANKKACEALIKFREQGGFVMLISNAPRPSGPVRQQMFDLGAPENIFDDSTTSGDVTRSFIEENVNKKIYHLGPERDRALFEGLDAKLVDPEEAELVVLSGLWNDDVETPEDYEEILARIQKHHLPMFCANPDIVVEKGDKIIYAAGAIAQAYDEIGGKVDFAGKPYLPVYDRALEGIEKGLGRKVSRDRVLAIGDSIKTDMMGAHNAGIDALFISSGIHMGTEAERATIDLERVNDLFATYPFRPIGVQGDLSW